MVLLTLMLLLVLLRLLDSNPLRMKLAA